MALNKCLTGIAVHDRGEMFLLFLLFTAQRIFEFFQLYFGKGEDYLSFCITVPATLSPSIAALTIPPAYPAPSPQG